MENDNPGYVFFDIGETLGTVQLSDDGANIERIEIFPGVTEVLRALNDHGVILGIISNPGTIGPDTVTAALNAAGLLQFFDSSLIVFGIKDSTSIFIEAVGLAGQNNAPHNCLFVGENKQERHFAQLAGLRTTDRTSAVPQMFHF